MTEIGSNGTAGSETGAEKAGDARKTRGIRFSESEWEEAKRAAAAHEMPVAEFVREKILALARAPEGADAPPRWPRSWRRWSSGCSATPGSWRPKSATRWSAKGAKTRSTRWWRRPRPSTKRCARVPATEPGPGRRHASRSLGAAFSQAMAISS